jgi:hypothetical protein
LQHRDRLLVKGELQEVGFNALDPVQVGVPYRFPAMVRKDILGLIESRD